MLRELALAIICIFIFSGCISKNFIQSTSIVTAADGVGLVKAEHFVETLRSEDELAYVKAHPGWFDLPEGASEVILRYPRYLLGRHESDFNISVYRSNRGVEHVSVTAPVVNGTQEENELMIETLYSIGEAMFPGQPLIRKWIEVSWQKSWENYYKDGIQRADVIHERDLGNYRVSVAGVPPDIIKLGVLRL